MSPDPAALIAESRRELQWMVNEMRRAGALDSGWLEILNRADTALEVAHKDLAAAKAALGQIMMSQNRSPKYVARDALARLEDK